MSAVILRMGGTFASKHSDGSFHVGGEQRLRAIEHLLANLVKLNVPCYLLTTSHPSRVEQDLSRWGLTRYFVGRSGKLRILHTQISYEGETVNQLLTCRGLTPSSALYIDHCAVACQRVAKTNTGLRTKTAILGETICQDIINQLQQHANYPHMLEKEMGGHGLGVKDHVKQDCARAQGNTNGSLRAIFDFDHTLAQAMVYNDLRQQFGVDGPPSVEMARRMPNEWWISEFGGQDRIHALSKMLTGLRRMGVKCSICSQNNDEVIKEGLGRVGLLSYFQDDGGVFRIVPKGGDKGTRVHHYLESAHTLPSNTCFVDDDTRNIIDVKASNLGIATVRCSEQGITQHNTEDILHYFANKLSPAGA